MKTQKKHIFPAIIGVSSLVVLLRIIEYPFDIYGAISVLVGSTGIFLFYRGNSRYDRFFYAWVILQVPNLYLTRYDSSELPLANVFLPTVIPGASINFGIGFNLSLKNGGNLSAYFNLLPIGLYYLFKFLNAEKPLGAFVSIGRLRKGTFPQIQFPVTGTIHRLGGRIKMTGVYEVKLDSEIIISNKKYNYVLLDPKDYAIIQPGKKQICALRLCEAPGAAFDNLLNPFVDWVTVDCRK